MSVLTRGYLPLVKSGWRLRVPDRFPLVSFQLLGTRRIVLARSVDSAVAVEEDQGGGRRTVEGIVGRVLEIGLYNGHVLARQDAGRAQLHLGFQVTLEGRDPANHFPAGVSPRGVFREAAGEQLVALTPVVFAGPGGGEGALGLGKLSSLVVLKPGRLQQGLCQLSLYLAEAATHGAHRHIKNRRYLFIRAEGAEVAQHRRDPERLRQLIERRPHPLAHRQPVYALLSRRLERNLLQESDFVKEGLVPSLSELP